MGYGSVAGVGGSVMRELSRRDAIKIGVGSGFAVLAATFLDTPSADAATPQYRFGADALVGRVTATSRDAITVATEGTTVQVLLVYGIRAYSGAFGGVSSGTDFVVGDVVVAQGLRQGPVVHAQSVGSIFSPLRARVLSVSQDRQVARTDIGIVDLRDGQVPFPAGDRDAARRQRLADDLVPGRVISGSGWMDPRSGTWYLLIPAMPGG